MFPSVAYNCETLVMHQMSHQMSHNYFILTVLPATVPAVAVDVGADWCSAYYIISV